MWFAKWQPFFSGFDALEILIPARVNQMVTIRKQKPSSELGHHLFEIIAYYQLDFLKQISEKF